MSDTGQPTDRPVRIAPRVSFVTKPAPFGNTVTLPPLCPDECRLIEFGGCEGKCRLESQ